MTSFRQRFIVHTAAAIPISFGGAVLLTPILGPWRAVAILILCNILAIMYIEHRWPQGKERKP